MFQIEEAKNEDIKICAKIHVDAWRETYEGMMDKDFLSYLSYEKREQYLRQALQEQPDLRHFKLLLNNRVIGVMNLQDSRDEDCVEEGELTSIYLLKEYWKHGLGRKAIIFALTYFQEQQKPSIILWVLEDNKGARHFYERMGFVFDNETKELPISGKFFLELRYRYRY